MLFAILLLILQITPTPSSPSVLQELVTARFETSNPRPLTGEAFTLELIVSLPPSLELVELPTFPDEWGDFEVREVGEVTIETLADGIQVYRQSLTVKLWVPRDFLTPDTYISYRLNGGNEALQVPVRQASITVPTVLDFDNLSLKPFKPLIYLPYVSPFVILAGVLTVGGIAGFSYHRWKNRPARAVPKAPEGTPLDNALRTLETLKKRDDLPPKETYTQTSDILRVYIQAMYEVSAATTGEVIEGLRDRLPEKGVNDLQRILSEADLVKFAGIIPDAEISRRVIEMARRWLISVDKDMDA
jgi:hypothetical protein